MTNLARIMAYLCLLLSFFLTGSENSNSFSDNLAYYDQTRWVKSDGWSNGGISK